MPPAGVEPAAHGLGNRCSILLSYGGPSYLNHNPLRSQESRAKATHKPPFFHSCILAQAKDTAIANAPRGALACRAHGALLAR